MPRIIEGRRRSVRRPEQRHGDGNKTVHLQS
jgi:hypothetical protein